MISEDPMASKEDAIDDYLDGTNGPIPDGHIRVALCFEPIC